MRGERRQIATCDRRLVPARIGRCERELQSAACEDDSTIAPSMAHVKSSRAHFSCLLFDRGSSGHSGAVDKMPNQVGVFALSRPSAARRRGRSKAERLDDVKCQPHDRHRRPRDQRAITASVATLCRCHWRRENAHLAADSGRVKQQKNRASRTRYALPTGICKRGVSDQLWSRTRRQSSQKCWSLTPRYCHWPGRRRHRLVGGRHKAPPEAFPAICSS